MNANETRLAEALRKTLPYLRDNAAYYMDDGVNEPLELARDIEELLNAHTADRVPAASVHDDFVAWQCEKCGRYHHKNFPDEGCDWCSGAAISKRLGLSAAAIPQPAQPAQPASVPDGWVMVPRKDVETVLYNRPDRDHATPEQEKEYDAAAERVEAALCAAAPQPAKGDENGK